LSGWQVEVTKAGDEEECHLKNQVLHLRPRPNKTTATEKIFESAVPLKFTTVI